MSIPANQIVAGACYETSIGLKRKVTQIAGRTVKYIETGMSERGAPYLSIVEAGLEKFAREAEREIATKYFLGPELSQRLH
jgi:hypothetical protein